VAGCSLGRLRRLLGEKYTLGGPGRVRLPRTGPSRVVSPDNVSPHDRAARGRRIENEHETIYFGDDVVGRGEREAGSDGASPYPELRPPMVCVKLPKSVLGLFHLFRATKLPLLRIEGSGRCITLNRVSSWRLIVPICIWTRQPPIGACRFSTAHDAIYASVPRGTSTPNLPTGSSPKGENGRAPLQSRRGSKIFGFLGFLFLLKIISSPQTRGLGQSPI
jgi:hypothetical protein